MSASATPAPTKPLAWAKLVRSQGFLIGEPNAVPCPVCKHAHTDLIVTGTHLVFRCEEKKRGGVAGERCNTWIFALRFERNERGSVLSIALDGSDDVRALLKRLEPEREN